MGLFDDMLDVPPTPKPKKGSGAVAFVDPFMPPPPKPAPIEEPPPEEFEPLNVEPDEPGILGTIGHILDTPGRFVRQGITGKKDASGRDVLRTLGWENDDKDGFLTPAGIAGFATELALDPLNLLPGFFGLKAATKAGKAAALVGSHLDDAERAVKAAKWGERALKERIAAKELAGGVLDEASILAEKAKIPQAKTDLFGDILKPSGDARFPTVQKTDRELVESIAGRDDEVGRAAKELIDSGAQSFRPLSEAGDRVKAGQEALFSVGGEVDPFGLFRLGGKYNPVNWLPEVPGLTAPLQLPQKTIIEGADAAQKIQDFGRGIGDLPGIKQAKALFSKVPGAPLASQEALQQMAKDSRTEARAGGAAAEDAARAFNDELQGLGKVELPPAPGLKEADIDVMDTPGATLLGDEWVDPMTGKVLGPNGTLKPNPLGRAPEKVRPVKPEYEDFEAPGKGQTVRFFPKDAATKATNARREQFDVIVDILERPEGPVAVTKKGWEVPLDRVSRPASRVKKDYNAAVREYEAERQFGDRGFEETEAIKQQAADTRRAIEETHGGRGDLIGWQRGAALKSERENLMKELGHSEFGDLEQAQALPKALEHALERGVIPQLKTVEWTSFDSGAVGIGDEIPLGGDVFTVEGINPATGKLKLQGEIAIEVPADFVPFDKGVGIRRAKTAQAFDPIEQLNQPVSVADELPDPLADLAGPSPKIAKLNKAADVLAGAESKLNVKPFEVPEELLRPETVADLGKSQIPGVVDDMLKREPARPLSIGEASNPPTLSDFAERQTDAATRAADDAERARIEAFQQAGATTTGELNDAGKLKFEGGDMLSDAALDRVRGLDKAAQQTQNTARVATVLADAGEKIGTAAKQANDMMKGRSMDAGAAITEALETGVAAPKEIAGIVTKVRNRLDEMLELERDITPALVDERVKYVTHVPTEAGTQFFRRIGKNKAAQTQLFVELEKKRMAVGLKGNLDDAAKSANDANLPTDPALRAEILTDRAKAKHRPGPTSRPVPASVKAEWDKTLATMDPAARKFIEDNGLVKEYLDFGKDISLQHGSQIPRLKQYKGLTVSELNDVMGKFGSKGPVYNPNPAAQLFTREMRHAKVMAGKSFLDNVAQQFGRPDANIPDVMKSLADDTISPEGFRQMMGIEDPQTAKAAFDALKRMTDEEELGALVDGFDKLTRAWKGWITRGFPAYHVRNHIGNRLQAWLTGVPLAGEHVELGHKLVGGVDFKVKLGDGKILDRDALLKEMQQTGTLKGGFFEQNLKEALDETASKFDPLNPDNAFIGAAERVSAGIGGGLNQVLAGNAKGALKMDGNAIEGADRASTYLYWRQKGFSPRASAAKTDEAMFDYSKENLSPFEQKYLNRGVFFYGYMRNVLPFMLGALSENGAKVAQMLKLGTQPGRPDFVPEYAAAGLQLPLGVDEQGNSKMAYSLGTPVESAVEPFAQNPLTMLNPFFKIPLELASGRDFFLGKDIADAKKAPNFVDNLPDVLQGLLGTVKTPTKTGGERVEIDPNIAYALRNNPFSRIGTTASKIFDERKDPFDILQNLGTGARVVSIDDEQEKQWRMKDRAKERLKELAAEGRAKVGKYESFGRAGGAKKGADAEVDMLLALANPR